MKKFGFYFSELLITTTLYILLIWYFASQEYVFSSYNRGISWIIVILFGVGIVMVTQYLRELRKEDRQLELFFEQLENFRITLNQLLEDRPTLSPDMQTTKLRKTIDESMEILKGQLEDAHNIAEKLKEELKFLEEKLREAKIKRDNLVTKQRAAETKQKLYDAADKVSRQLDSFTAAEKVLEGFEGFAKFEEKIEKQMAEIEAREELSDDSLDREFQKMERDRELEAELAALKEKIGS